MCSARKRGALRREAERRQQARHVRGEGVARRDSACASARRASASLSCPRGLKPAYQMSNGSSGRPRRLLMSRADALARAATSSTRLAAAPRPRLRGSRGRASKRRIDEGGVVGVVGIGRALGLEDAQPAPVALVGLALGAAARAARRRAPVTSFTGETATAPVSGVQSSSGLLTTAAGIFWRTMRSITAAIRRCSRQAVGVGVARLELVAQVPVADQAQAGREQPLPVRASAGGACRRCSR